MRHTSCIHPCPQLLSFPPHSTTRLPDPFHHSQLLLGCLNTHRTSLSNISASNMRHTRPPDRTCACILDSCARRFHENPMPTFDLSTRRKTSPIVSRTSNRPCLARPQAGGDLGIVCGRHSSRASMLHPSRLDERWESRLKRMDQPCRTLRQYPFQLSDAPRPCKLDPARIHHPDATSL